MSRLVDRRRVYTQGKEDALELSEDHGAVVGFVVQLHALNEIFNGADILVLLDLAEDGQEFISLDLLLSCNVIDESDKCQSFGHKDNKRTLLLGATHLLNLSQGGVQVKSTESIAQVEHVHSLVTLKVVDGEGEFPPC